MHENKVYQKTKARVSRFVKLGVEKVRSGRDFYCILLTGGRGERKLLNLSFKRQLRMLGRGSGTPLPSANVVASYDILQVGMRRSSIIRDGIIKFGTKMENLRIFSNLHASWSQTLETSTPLDCSAGTRVGVRTLGDSSPGSKVVAPTMSSELAIPGTFRA